MTISKTERYKIKQKIRSAKEAKKHRALVRRNERDKAYLVKLNQIAEQLKAEGKIK